MTFTTPPVSNTGYDLRPSIDLPGVPACVSPPDLGPPPPEAHAPIDEDSADARRAATRDVDAFERLHRRHARQVHRLARRFLGRGEADDATQDVFLRAWDKLDLFRGEAAFGTWLYRLAMNVILRRAEQARRYSSRHVGIDETNAGRMSREPEPSESPVDVEAALAQLEEGLRQVAVLHDMEGFSHAEIAEMLGITVGGSRMRLHRARLALREFVRGQDKPGMGRRRPQPLTNGEGGERDA